MHRRKSLIIIFTITLIPFLSTATNPLNLDYDSIEPSFNPVYSGNATSSTVNYTTNVEFDNCTISTQRSSLPLGWETSEPTFKEINSTGYHKLETPKITAVEYPENSTINFELYCQSSKKASSATFDITVDIENPSKLPYQYIREKAPYAVLACLIIVLATIISKMKKDSAEKKAEKMSRELIQHLQRRSYTPPEVKRKIKTAQQKIQEEDYEDAVKLLEEADQNLDRT